MPHALGVSEYVKERVLRIRGGLRIYKDLQPERTALVVIDMQNAFVAAGGSIEVPVSRTIVPAINRVSHECRELGMPVVWTRSHHFEGGADWHHFYDHFYSPERRKAAALLLAADAPESHLYPEMDVHEGDFVVDKNRFSCFISGSSGLERLLRNLDRDTIVLCGTQTNVCVESTARDGMMLDFRVVVLSDATATLSDAEQQHSLDALIQNFADVLTVDQLLIDLKADARSLEPVNAGKLRTVAVDAGEGN